MDGGVIKYYYCHYSYFKYILPAQILSIITAALFITSTSRSRTIQKMEKGKEKEEERELSEPRMGPASEYIPDQNRTLPDAFPLNYSGIAVEFHLDRLPFNSM